MSPAPRFSIIIPCYNQGAFVHEALDSVRVQSLPAHEIIVVDDGSTDAWTSQRLDELCQPPIRLVRQENRGLSGARNAGIAVATGDWILPLDADDKLEADALATYAEAIAAAPEVDIWYPDIHHFGLTDDRWECPEFNRWRQLWFNQMVCSSAIRRRVFEAGVHYNERMRHGYEDWEFFIHAACERDFQARALKRPIFRYRRWGHSMLSDSDARRKEIIDQLHRERSVFQDEARLLALKRKHNPFLSIAARSPELRTSLDRQDFQDWRLADEADTVLQQGDLALFQQALASRLLVSLDDAALARCLEGDPYLLEKVVRMCVDRNPSILWLVTTDAGTAYPGLERFGEGRRDRCIAMVVSAGHLFDYPELPKTDAGLVVDLKDHLLHHHPGSTLRCIAGARADDAEGIAVPESYAPALPAMDSPAQAGEPASSELRNRLFLVGMGVSKLARGLLGERRHDRLHGARYFQTARRLIQGRAPERTSAEAPVIMAPRREGRAGPYDIARHCERRHRDDAWFVIKEAPKMAPARDAEGDALLIAVPWIVHGGVDRAIVDLLAGLSLVAPNMRKYLVTSLPAEMCWAPEVLSQVQGVFSLPGGAVEHTSAALCSLIDRLGVGTLMIANSKAASDALPAVRRMKRRVRVVFQAHNFETDPGTGMLVGQAAYAASRFNNLIDAYTAISEDTQRSLCERLYVSPGKVRVVYLGVEVPRFAAARRQRFSQRPATVLWLGRMTHQKDPMLAVDVARAWLRKHGPDSLRFVFAGGGDLEGAVRAAVQGELEQLVSLPGAVNDPVPLYREADCLMMTSRYEGIPVVVYEAIAAGLPIVTPTADTANAEVLSSREATLIQRRADVSEYVAALERWMENPRHAQAQSERLIERAEEFGLARYARETLAVLFPPTLAAAQPGRSKRTA